MCMESFYVRKMLLQYDKQLIADRRLRRHMRELQSVENSDTISPELKRRILVDRVTQEVFENMLFSGSNNPIVREVKEALEKELGEKLSFKFPPAKLDFEIYKETAEGSVRMPQEEVPQILDKLWNITRQKVDDTML